LTDCLMSYRQLLPDDVIPESYDLTLEPDLEKYVFDGEVKILCDVKVATDVITLHAYELTVSDASFKAEEDSKTLEADQITVTKSATTVALTFKEQLPTGKGCLTVKFRGILNDQMAGFYRSQYTNSKGQKVFMGTTQFEAIDARRCFPCWDEPGRKATFTVTLIVPADLMALSNMPESRQETLPGNRKKVAFMPTPKMSTYLLAFCIGEYESIQGMTKDGTLLRILCVPGKMMECSYALKCGIQALEFYNEFFGVPFPLPKMDMIAIPDFSAGAMENWGLVTYREVALLCEEKTVSITMKQRICSVIAHELAHQWFGNLVTMTWWDDLWLNEGFANWMQTFCSDKITPEWKMWEIYVGMEQARSLQLDGLRSSHPIQVPIANARDVEEVFDAISYCKGGSIVRMLYAVLGGDNFRKGLQLYFKRHAYGNTETADLAKAWAESSGMPIEDLVGSWTSKMGFPVLKVLSDPFEAASDTVELEQSWFLADGSTAPGDDAVSWAVPILAGSDKATADITIWKEKKGSVKVPAQGASWLKLNYGQHVPCRVLYPPSMVKRLSSNLSALPAEDRIGLLSDTYALTKAGLADPAQLVDLLQGFDKEENDKVWSELSSILSGLKKVIKGGLEEGCFAGFCRFAASIVMPCAMKVGFDTRDGDSENTKKLRQTMIGLLATFCSKEPAVWSEAEKKLSILMEGDPTGAVSGDVRSAVFTMAVKNDTTPETFEKLIKLHNATSDGILKRDIYTAITGGTIPLQKRALDWCLTEDVKSQDMVWIPMGVASSGSAEAADATLQWIKESYDSIYTRLGATSMMLFSNIVRTSGLGFVTEAKADEVESFWAEKPLYERLKKTVSQTKEGIQANSKFVDRLKNSDLSKSTFWTDKFPEKSNL